ncbi:MAG: hypothetical protein ACI9MC_000868 [Kiritimatiellia bacterium]|jgi:hypothetical protein
MIGETEKRENVLRVRVDPVSAPIIPRRDDAGRGVVVLGHGLPLDQLAWLADEVERRRRRATQSPAPSRRKTGAPAVESSAGFRFSGAPGEPDEDVPLVWSPPNDE